MILLLVCISRWCQPQCIWRAHGTASCRFIHWWSSSKIPVLILPVFSHLYTVIYLFLFINLILVIYKYYLLSFFRFVLAGKCSQLSVKKKKKRIEL